MAGSVEQPSKYDWAGEQGERWLANVERFEAMLAPIGEALLERAGYGPGDRVLDIGCGGGASTRAIADAVGPNGAVLGVDISANLINHAAATSEQQAGISYTCADASTFSADGPQFNRLHSRFGSMFFDDPHTAFANLHAQLEGGAQMDLAVWANPRDNPWMMEMMGVVRGHVEVPPTEPRTPGPFAFEDLAYLEEVLNAGGFKDMQVVPYEREQAIGGPETDPEDATRFVMSSLGVGQILAEQAEEVRLAAARDLTAMFEKHHRPGEGVMLGCKAWLVSACA